jgi:hypothetical protein
MMIEKRSCSLIVAGFFLTAGGKQALYAANRKLIDIFEANFTS